MMGGFMLWRYAIPRDVSMVMRSRGLAHVSLFSGLRRTENKSPRSRNSVTKQLKRHGESQNSSRQKKDVCPRTLSTYMFE